MNNKVQQFVAQKILVILLLLCALVSVSPGINAETANPNTSMIIKEVFDNGLTLIVKPNTANEVVSVNAFIRMGAIYETADQRGISKLMQRIITKGTQNRTAHDIVFETESVGASIDAGLADYGYGVTSLKTTLIGLDKGLEVFLDIMCHPVFPAEEVAKEKQFMIQQLLSSEDQPTNVVIQNYINLYYGNHPIGIKSETIAENIQKITREQLITWYQKIYTPNNMVISIVGNVDPKQMAARFQNTLGKLTKTDLPVVVDGQISFPKEDRQVIQTRQSQALFMVVGYPAPTVFDPDYPVMEVISYILGGDMSSRMFVELREKKGLAYNVSTGYYGGNYPSTIFAFMATEPGNYQAAKAGIIAEFQKLTTGLVPAEELKDAKEAIKGGFLMSHETNSEQARLLGSYELLGLGYQQDTLYPELISKVTAEDIQRVARKYFQHYSLSAVSPVEIIK